MNRKSKDLRLAGLFAVIWLSALLFGVFIRKQSGLAFDYWVLDGISSIVNPVLTPIVQLITFTGDPIIYFIYLIPLAGYLIWKKQYRMLGLLLASVLVAFLANEGMKALFQRVRPVGYALIQQGGFSYPSGHSMVGASFYTTAAWALEDRNPRWGQWSNFLYLYAFLPGLSRLYLGVHYPSDVFFGILLGLSVAVVCIRGMIYTRRKKATLN